MRKLFDLKIFVETDADVRLGRRVIRDVAERGRTVNSYVIQDKYIVLLEIYIFICINMQMYVFFVLIIVLE